MSAMGPTRNIHSIILPLSLSILQIKKSQSFHTKGNRIVTDEELENGNSKKAISFDVNEVTDSLNSLLTVINELEWLTERFGDEKYDDIAGLCKLATIEEIKEKGYSLTP